jgi:hypothetical protein
MRAHVPPLGRQLVEGGVLVHPLGPGGDEDVLAYRRRSGTRVFEAVWRAHSSCRWLAHSPPTPAGRPRSEESR